MDKGLPNMGNTCYINSILQCLRYSKPFVFQLRELVVTRDTPLVQSFVDLLFAGATRVTLNTFVSQLSLANKEFSLLRQCDAHELFLFIVDKFFTRFNKRYTNSFEGMFLSKITCTACGNVSESKYPFVSISVEMNAAKVDSITELLERFCSVESLDDLIDCDKCHTKKKSTKQLTIDTLPTILVVHLKRFQGLRKLSTPVKLDTELSIKGTKYRLYAMCNHSGGLRGGHYTASCRRRSGGWIMCNDNFVTDMSGLPSQSSHPYVLFYTSEFK